MAGVARRAKELSEQFVKNGYSVTVLTSYPREFRSLPGFYLKRFEVLNRVKIVSKNYNPYITWRLNNYLIRNCFYNISNLYSNNNIGKFSIKRTTTNDYGHKRFINNSLNDDILKMRLNLTVNNSCELKEVNKVAIYEHNESRYCKSPLVFGIDNTLINFSENLKNKEKFFNNDIKLPDIFEKNYP